MTSVHSPHLGYLADARTVVNGIADGHVGRGRKREAVEIVRAIVMDIRNAVYREGGSILVEAWLAQATEILDVVVYQGRPVSDLDWEALRDCLTEAACALQ